MWRIIATSPSVRRNAGGCAARLNRGRLVMPEIYQTSPRTKFVSAQMQNDLNSPHSFSLRCEASHSVRHDLRRIANSRDSAGELRYESVANQKKERRCTLEIDGKIARVKELIAKREELDAELSELLGGAVRERRSPKCSICGQPGHRASTCPTKGTEPVTE